MHVNFGIDVINQIKLENEHLWDDDMRSLATRMILEGTELETRYAQDTMPRGVLGMNANTMPNTCNSSPTAGWRKSACRSSIPARKTRSRGCPKSWT